ncbi:type II secretion system F family protein [Thioalkalivibrio thiocyanodenitrificans]|uniref:type II secretion system F family protein n=1 Tax=Thioalkalivibrio thiocyanodenitrificans TaxID=243063 RepID=UPI0003748EE7|nr:type II secretion system F family protein [Thioalkalivibrio thiocyanodenitrificans]
MAIYQIRIQAKKGGVRTIEVEANKVEDAKRIAKRQGRPLSVKKRATFFPTRGLTPAERQTFLQRLASMLGSRVGAGEALTLLRDTFSGRIRTVSNNLLRRVEAGEDIPEALEAFSPQDFPITTVALIKAGSRAGDTWKSLQDAARFELEMHHIKKSSGKGLWSGIGGFVLAAIITVISTAYIGPEVMSSPMMQAMSDSINIGWLFVVGDIVTWIMGTMLAGLAFLVLLGTLGRQWMPNLADKLIMKIPYYKDLVLSRNNYIVLYGLSILIGSGVRMEDALSMSHSTAPRGALKEDLGKALEAVRVGKPWPTAMGTLHPTDKAALAASQDREQIAAALNVLATQYREIYGQRLETFVPIMQLLAALFLSIAGGLLFGMTILPMLQATEGAF